MRWFKHFSDNYRGRSIDTFYEELGHTGISCYYLLLELCTEKLEKNKHEILTNYDIQFSFARRFVQRNLRVGSTKLESFLNIGQGLGLFSYEFSQKEIKIRMPILLELLHSDVIKSSSSRESVKTQSCPDKELDKERDKERDKEYKSPEPQAVAVVNSSLFIISSTQQIPIKHELVKSWADTYPKEFLLASFKEMRNWVLSNQQKAPKSNWTRFMNNWFARGWERHRTTIKSNPTQITADDLNEILRGE